MGQARNNLLRQGETKTVELQGSNASGTPVVFPHFPFCRLPQSSRFPSSLSKTPSSRRLSEEASPSSLVGVQTPISQALRDGEGHVEFAYVDSALDR